MEGQDGYRGPRRLRSGPGGDIELLPPAPATGDDHYCCACDGASASSRWSAPKAFAFLRANSKKVVGLTLKSWWVERSTCELDPALQSLLNLLVQSIGKFRRDSVSYQRLSARGRRYGDVAPFQLRVKCDRLFPPWSALPDR